MPYLGNNLGVAFSSYKLIDSLTASFNGTTTSFALTVNGVTPVPFPLNEQNILLSVGGVPQKPDSTGTEGFRFSGSNIVFSSAPKTGEAFWGVILAGADRVNAGVQYPDGTASVPSISFASQTTTGFYRSGSGQIGVGINGSTPVAFSTSGVQLNGLTSGSVIIASPAVAGNNTLTLPTSNGSSNQFLKNGATAGSLGWSSLVEDSSGRVLVGTSTARSNFYNSTNSPQLQIEGNDNSKSALAIIQDFNANTQGAQLILAKNNSTTIGTNVLVANGDTLGVVSFQGNDGSEFVEAAAISAQVDGTPGTNDMPGRLVFSTTADGASSPTERMKIDNAGNLFSYQTYASTTVNAANINIQPDGRFYRSTSSIKYKTDVETLGDEYADAILNCRPVWYRSTTGNDAPDWGWWGFIAEEVAEIDPRLVSWKTQEISYDDKGSAVTNSCEPEPEGVQYDRFVPHLLNLVKRQQQAIETLEAKVAALEAA